LYLLVSAVGPQRSGVKCYYVTAGCHHSYRKNDSPHSVECDIVMTDTSSSQQGGMRGIASPLPKCWGMGDYLIIRDSRKSRKHGSRVFRQLPCFFQLPCFAVFFCNFVGLLTVLHSFLIIN